MPANIETTRRLSLKEFLEREGMDLYEALEEWGFESVVPSLCEDGCEVEPDGKCPHGHPSLLLAAGVI